VRRHEHRVDARLGARAVRAAALDVDVEERAARHHRPRAHREGSERHPGPVVHAEHRFAGKALEEAVLDHGACAADAFLGGLEDEVHRAVEMPRPGEVFRRAEEHRGVAVVAAGVHAAVVRGLVAEAVRFPDRQRIHVRAQPDRTLCIS
jgi:hypothetical protein